MAVTQKQFAQLLEEAMDVLDVSNVALGARTGTHVTTISRYRDPGYASGPPAEIKRRALEAALGVPSGYLDGETSADLEAIRARLVAEREQLRRGAREGQHDGESPADTVYPAAIRALQQEAGGGATVRFVSAVHWLTMVYLAKPSTSPPAVMSQADLRDRLDAAQRTDPPAKQSRRARRKAG